jgi:alkylation response protein AidB-like acyl-CoA dehydrogenase
LRARICAQRIYTEEASMNFGFTEEQEMLRSEARKFLDEKYPMTEVRRILESAEGHCPKLWKEMAELGWLGLVIPESCGGAELSWVDLVVLLEETGRSLLPSPLVSSTLAALAIAEHGSPEQRERWLPAIAQGESVFSVALIERSDALGPEAIALEGRREGDGTLLFGEKIFVPDAALATHFVLSYRSADDVGLAVVERNAAGLAVEDLASIDPTKRLGKIALEGVSVGDEALLVRPAGPAGKDAVSRLLDWAAAAVSAEAIGAAEAAHALTVQYAKERVQFDSPIGRFQGVKHPLAEMYVDIESFKSILYYSAWCLDESPDEAPRYVSMAKAYVSDAFARIGIDGVELHGALGYTWEYDAQLYLRRSKWVKAMFGDSDYHYERVTMLGGL